MGPFEILDRPGVNYQVTPALTQENLESTSNQEVMSQAEIYPSFLQPVSSPLARKLRRVRKDINIST